MVDNEKPGRRINLRIPLLREILIIVLSVLLALALDEWYADYELRQELETDIARLNREIAGNFEELDRFCSTIAERLARLQSHRERVESGERFALFRAFNEFAFPELSDAVWQRISRDSRSNRMDAAYLELVHRLYYHNALQNELNRSISEFVYSPEYSDPEKVQVAYWTAMRLISQQVIWTDEALEGYARALQQSDVFADLAGLERDSESCRAGPGQP